MFAALDLASGQMFYRFRDRKRWPQFLDFCKQLRRRFPTGKRYLICDNYGPHGKAEVRTWCEANDIELVHTPTHASWLNWIECEFTAVRYFTLDGSDYPDHAAQETAIAGYLRWRNRHCHPKRRFAVHSKIRRPDHLPTLLDEALGWPEGRGLRSSEMRRLPVLRMLAWVTIRPLVGRSSDGL